jgi:hypothetical protein
MFEAFIVKDKALHQVLSQLTSPPLMELGTSERTHSVSYCGDSDKEIVLHRAMSAAPDFGSNL